MPTYPIDIETFKSRFEGGARQYLFFLNLLIPNSTVDASYLVRASSLPSSTIEPAEVPWQGMTYSVGTTPTYDDWTVTFSVDRKAALRRAFLNWHLLIHNPETNEHGNPESYMVDQRVSLLDYDGSTVLTYKLIGGWPTTIGELTLDYSAKDVAQFDVTFKYHYYVVER